MILGSSIGQSAERVIYPYYVRPELNDLAEPTAPLAGQVQFEILNFYGEGLFDPHTITFQSGSSGARRELRSERTSTLTRFAGDTSQDLCNQLLQGALFQQVDQLALNQMSERDAYVDGNQFSFYVESGRDLDPDQTVYLQSVSWHTPAQVRQSFGGKIPWERIIEVEAPPGLSREQLTRAIEVGEDGVRLKLRRSVLRIVAGATLNSQAQMISRFELPWEQESRMRSRYSRQYGHYALSFELGRAAQERVFQGEATELARLAALVALHYSWVISVYPGGNLPANAIEIVAHSLAETRTKVFKRGLGLDEHPTLLGQPSDPNDILLSAPLSRVLEKIKPSRTLKSIREIQEAFGGQLTEVEASALLVTYRVIAHGYVDFRTREFDFTQSGPVVIRNESALRDYGMRMFLQGGNRTPPRATLDRAMKALRRAGVPESPRPFSHFEEDLGAQDWKALGLRPIVISNLMDEWLQADPDSLIKLLLAFHSRVFLSGKVVPELLEKLTVAVTARIGSAVDRELSKLDLKRVAIAGGVAHLMTATDFSRLRNARPELLEDLEQEVGFDPGGYWHRRQLLSTLPGI